jgi:hypothetical protein
MDVAGGGEGFRRLLFQEVISDQEARETVISFQL